ncbi:cupin domain-containing protein [Patescibacteria group bacterium]|nr:cupin domain-containing protein [Patescibacteria group bacterium]
MKGFIVNIEKATEENGKFRQVLYTARYSQLVVMSIPPQGEIGEEVHGLDQFLRIESGEGKTVLNGVETPISAGFAIVVPAGTRHNFVNTSATEDLKLYTVYAPPNHKDGTVHETKAAADANEEHFDGQTTEQ